MDNNQPTQEQIKEFWEWCGVLCPNCGKHIATGDKVKVYYKPDICYCHSVQLDIDLNFLFKYAVPKLCTVSIQTFNRPDNGNDTWLAIVSESPASNHKEAYNDVPELALFWAIWEAIHA